MRRVLMLLVIVMGLLLTGGWAQDDQSDGQNRNNAASAFPKMPSIPMMPRITGPQGPKIVVATSDGGIVIVQGNIITKFDKNLNITKSVELQENKSQ